MSSSNPTKAQAQVLLQALCKFLVPAIQTVIRGKEINVDQMSSGAEADGLLTELENFISGMQPRTKDLAIKASLKKPPVHRTQDVSTISFNENSPYAIARPISNPVVDREVNETLQKIRENIYQTMPIRLLCFEHQTSNARLKISLLEKNEVYNYLAAKVRADVHNGKSPGYSSKYTGYAILSHTWSHTPGELTYGDWKNGSLDDTQPKCQKLINFCKAAWKDHGLTLGWIDTVCINKESSSELDESIRSMYAWYSNADVCITYLAGTSMVSDMRNDPWFSGGWTLQELVAPIRMKFYSRDWNRLSGGKSSHSDKGDPLILEEISRATTMDPFELDFIRKASISRRMQLAAKRQVTREEDIAYCLMGIFDVSISTAYGEGAKRAFSRLVEEIFRSTKDVSNIFNWGGKHDYFTRQPITSLFPSCPSDYLNHSSNKQLRPWRPIEPFTLTHLGLRTPILLMPAVPIRESVMDYQLIGDYHATISIDPFEDIDGFEVPKDYHLLDKRFSGPEGVHHVKIFLDWTKRLTLTFGTLNVEEHGTSIHIPKACLAVLLQLAVELRDPRGSLVTHSPDYSRRYTEKPIVFDLRKTGSDTDNQDKHYYELKKSKLAKHGMELITLYL